MATSCDTDRKGVLSKTYHDGEATEHLARECGAITARARVFTM